MDVEVAHAATIAAVADRLSAAGIHAARAEARWLVEHAVSAAGSGGQETDLEALVRRRLNREPLQLVLGSWSFRTVELALEPGVFLPRPETEMVAGLAIESACAAGPTPLVAEPCTGSGAIAASLLAEVPGVAVHATDIDPRAVDLARRNVAAQAKPGRCTVHQGDLLDPLPPVLRGQLDVLVANPPYLPEGDTDQLDIEVATHDPVAALFGGRQGLEVVARLLSLASGWLRPGGVVVLEIDSRFGEQALIAAAGAGLSEGALERDLTGRHRALVARRAEVAGDGQAVPCGWSAATTDRRAEAGP